VSGTALGGDGCCGNGNNLAVYLNSNFLGCYNPKIGGAVVTNSGLPTTSVFIETNYPLAPATTKPFQTTVSYAGPPPASTVPPSIPNSVPGIPLFTFLGCYKRTVTTQSIVGGLASLTGYTYTDPYGMTVKRCYNYCFANYQITFISLSGK
jgi:hypothetical protein